MIKRNLSQKILALAKQFPVISLTGPRQSGKTTLVQNLFPKYTYITLEDPDVRQRADEDPRGFLNAFQGGVILDEVQRVPQLFSYLQGIVDGSKKMGQFILTGSQNFLLLEKIGQSLAGRVAVLHLLPLGFDELAGSSKKKWGIDEVLYTGLYPALYDRKIDIKTWHSSYITTYLERDVRQIKQISDLNTFQKFMRLCAGRSGQLLNLSELGNECGVSHNTAKAWISILEASFIVFLLQPFHENFNKRLVKQPKLYFYDTGLLCALLGLNDASQVGNHYYRGAIFETFVVSEWVKRAYHQGDRPEGYFWRDHRGNEVDYLKMKGNDLFAVEIKSGATVSGEWFKSLNYFADLAGGKVKESFLIYGGEETYSRKGVKVVGWRDIGRGLD